MTHPISYDYLTHITADVRDYIEENFSADEIRTRLEDRDAWAEELNDCLWTEDSVTGNASGSYTFNTYTASAYLCHNWDLLAEALREFGQDVDVLYKGAEFCDVTIRCYLLGQAIEAALDELEA